MSVYVDDMCAAYGRMIMCHMLADSDAELHAMADRIGVSRQWWQGPPVTRSSHYDISLSKRASAVTHGAIEITQRQATAMNCRRRATGSLGDPESSLEWFKSQRPSSKASARTKPK